MLGLKKLVNFILIFIIILAGLFLFFLKKETLDKSEQKKLEILSLIDAKEIIESDYQWQIITQDNLKILIDPNQDLEKQINLVKQVLPEIDQKNLEYIGVDVKGQVYFK